MTVSLKMLLPQKQMLQWYKKCCENIIYRIKILFEYHWTIFFLFSKYCA